MRDNLELSFAAAQLTGCLLSMLQHGDIPTHQHAVVAKLVADVRRANGMGDEQTRKSEAA